MILVERHGDALKLTHDYIPAELVFLRGLPVRRFDPEVKAWLAPPSKSNVGLLRGLPDHAVMFTPEARDLIAGRSKPREEEAMAGLPAGFRFKTKSRPYQETALRLMRPVDGFALSLPPGAGKSKIYIEDIECCYLEKRIEAALFLCPNSIKKNILDEVGIHADMTFDVMVYAPHRREKILAWMKQKTHKGIPMLVMGTESLSSGAGYDVALKFLSTFAAGLYVDESHMVKTHSSERTKMTIKLARAARRRVVGTGTMILKGLVDSWAQYQVVSEDVFSQSFFAFRNRYARMGGYKAKQVVGDENVDEFLELVRPYTYCKTKKDILPDLPQQIWTTRTVEMTPKQKELYQGLKKEGLIETEHGLLSYTNALVRELRLQQITGGFVGGEITSHDQNGIHVSKEARALEGKNPKMDEVEAILDGMPAGSKLVVWARFIPEIKLIHERLTKKGIKCVKFMGEGMTDEEREAAKVAFRDDPSVTVFAGQIRTGGVGLNGLIVAQYAIYFSNDFSVLNRIQSEGRTHRIGQEGTVIPGVEGMSVLYIDLLTEGGNDQDIYESLRAGKDYTDVINERMKAAV